MIKSIGVWCSTGRESQEAQGISQESADFGVFKVLSSGGSVSEVKLAEEGCSQGGGE